MSDSLGALQKQCELHHQEAEQARQALQGSQQQLNELEGAAQQLEGLRAADQRAASEARGQLEALQQEIAVMRKEAAE